MIVSHKHKFLFISNPKTGTHTMYDYLPKHYDGERIGGFHETKVPEECKYYFTFTTIRDPFERLVSAWNSLLFQDKYRQKYMGLVGSDSFSDFVDWIISFPNDTVFTGPGSPVLCLQSVWLKEALPYIEMFVPTENMDTAFRLLPFSTGKDSFEAKLNREHKTFWQLTEYLSDDQVGKLTLWLMPDIEFYEDGLIQINEILETRVYD